MPMANVCDEGNFVARAIQYVREVKKRGREVKRG
jgi:hypothetical protein